MIKFARARSLKRNNGSLFSRLSRAEKYLTVRISRRDVDTASHVSFLCLRRGAEDKSTRARFVYERVLENANEHIRRKKKKEENNKMKYTFIVLFRATQEGSEITRNVDLQRRS